MQIRMNGMVLWAQCAGRPSVALRGGVEGRRSPHGDAGGRFLPHNWAISASVVLWAVMVWPQCGLLNWERCAYSLAGRSAGVACPERAQGTYNRG